MCRISSRILGAFLFAAIALPLYAGQTARVAPRAGSVTGQTVRQPYAAEFKVTTVQTLTNGTTITRERTEVLARDSRGRTMHSTTDAANGNGEQGVTYGNATDPVEGTQSTWNSRTKQAYVYKLPPQDQRKGCWASDSGNFRTSWYDGPGPGAPAPNGTVLANGSTIVPAVRPTPEVEQLGSSTIQGFAVRGVRYTTTFPAGQVGNDQPIDVVAEHWTSPQLGMSLRDITDDPRTGKQTREVVNVTSGDPDPSVFLPPDGYQVTTEDLHQVSCQQ